MPTTEDTIPITVVIPTNATPNATTPVITVWTGCGRFAKACNTVVIALVTAVIAGCKLDNNILFVPSNALPKSLYLTWFISSSLSLELSTSPLRFPSANIASAALSSYIVPKIPTPVLYCSCLSSISDNFCIISCVTCFALSPPSEYFFLNSSALNPNFSKLSQTFAEEIANENELISSCNFISSEK